MSIPLDRLYHYIESVAQDVYGDTVIYHFYPHGSKNIKNLKQSTNERILNNWHHHALLPHIYCHDQEPLDYDYYERLAGIEVPELPFYKECYQDGINMPQHNIRIYPTEIYDKCIILHSELNSVNVTKYSDSCFVPVYYWAHAFIALDWFRYAKHHPMETLADPKYKFLIYNRAWSGTREYRLKFADLLVESNLVKFCNVKCNSIEPDLNVHYSEYTFKNQNFKPNNELSDYFAPNDFSSCASADFDIFEYRNSIIEVVLETLYDDSRQHLTEKILRPIATGKPFILVSTPGSLQYLRDYGFETFSTVFDESYDNILDPVYRLKAIVKTMQEIVELSNDKILQLQEIARRNRDYFFSDKFFNCINSELATNMSLGIQEVINTNTSQRYLDFRKLLAQHPNYKKLLVSDNGITMTRQQVVNFMKIARKDYNRHLKTFNK